MSASEQTSTRDQAGLPRGTVTFVFTDIERSTERWERDRAAMAAAVARHDELMRGAIEASGGYVFKTVGDAFCAAFADAPRAIAAALAAQRALAATDWSGVDGLRVRMAVHTGNADERNGDYFGPTVNRVARLLAVGHGGQILVSGVATDLTQGQLPPLTSLRDLGAHRLKDLARPEQVYQLLAPDLPRDFPPLRSLAALPNNLPLQLTSFVGREQEVAALVARIHMTRLLTIVGTGGVGKTRTSLQVGAELLDAFPDGVWFVDLAPLTDPALVPLAAATAMGIDVAADQSTLDALVRTCKNKRALLLFDNCEHLVGAAAATIDTLLRGCPDITVVASSREALGIAGETVFRMPSLAVPAPEEMVTAEHAARYGALALFVDRASAANDRFVLDDDNAAAVADICRRLDGIALAIELAAPRVKVLSVTQLARRLDERFRILTGGSRTALPRQQTLRALIDWSYDLLTDDEKTVFRRAGVFFGGWDLDAATAVCGDAALESWDVLDRLASLSDKSLVVSELAGSEQRYRLLETSRAYALERLEQSGERERVVRAHAEHFLQRAQQAEAMYGTVPERLWRGTYETEMDNFRAALEWSLGKSGDPEAGARLAASLSWLFFELGLYSEGLRWTDAALEHVAGREDELAVRIRTAESLLAGNAMMKTRRLEAAGEAVRLARMSGTPLLLQRALLQLGDALRQLDRSEEAHPILEEGLQISRAVGSRFAIASALGRLALVELQLGRLDAARGLFEEVLASSRSGGFERLAFITLMNFAEMEFAAGNIDRAIALARETLGRPNVRRRGMESMSLLNLTAYYVMAGDHRNATLTAREALDTLGRWREPVYLALAMQHVAALGVGQEPRVAARLLGRADECFESIGATREPTERAVYDLLFARLRERLPETEIETLRGLGRTMTEAEGLARAAELVEGAARAAAGA